MKDSFILKVAIITSLIGIVVLFSVLLNTELPNSFILSDLDSEIKIEGEVIDLKKYDKMSVLTLDVREKVDVVIFDEFDIEGKLEVVGTVDEYNGKKQIIANKIIEQG